MKSNYKLYLLSFVLFLTNMTVFAQSGPGGDGDDDLVQEAPINSKLIILLVVGLFLAFRYYKSLNTLKGLIVLENNKTPQVI